ncbi:Protein CBG02091 [Caenorhabditis briggsae]|uniref:Protein CBG02091 n=1 Tax=Caenorhabditis briggsae TaxID=6238 RepID=A8WRY8_CAEBR|nr:Protein CBG02091 [Caenorhabditis briggsae]CAP23246.1 Protein CBG02091 [Caenorhabditis briggsae]
MELVDYILLVFFMVGITGYGLCKSREPPNIAPSTQATIFGSGISVITGALSLCSGFISSISLLGFPAEIYYQGSMMLWYIPMYCISFPIVAYVFIPVFYNAKLITAYQYFENRFNFSCRMITTLLFVLQMLLYNAVALYAPSLAIASLTDIPIGVSICITSLLSAVYISLGGAKAGIHTSAVQMLVIFVAMSAIIVISLKQIGISKAYSNVISGKRLILNDFRLNPTIRHSAWSLLIGGCGNIIALFGANQISIQKYMAMPTLKSAQRTAMLNIICNTIILVLYVTVGLLMYAHYQACDPRLSNKNDIFSRFVIDVMPKGKGAVGLIAAAIYSAGISTLSATFTSISSIIINDVWGVIRERHKMPALEYQQIKNAMRVLPIFLSFVSIGLAFGCAQFKGIILQASFIVFGAIGGPVLGSFVVGMFIPRVKGAAAVVGLLSSVMISFGVSVGATILKVRPVSLELGQCSNQTNTVFNEGLIGTVTSTPLLYGIDRIFAVSYQYYSVIAVITNVVVSFIVQIILDWCSRPTDTPTRQMAPLELTSSLLLDEQHDPMKPREDTLA